MKKKILLTYATRAGSTSEVAEWIAEVLRARGATVDVKPVPVVHDVKGYDAIIVGSAIRTSQWLPEAVAFVQAHHEDLSHIPTAYFVVSGLLRDDTTEMRDKVLAFLDPVRQILEPGSIGLFAGKIDFSTMGGFDRSIAEAVSTAQGDWRNWEAIRDWAQGLESVFA